MNRSWISAGDVTANLMYDNWTRGVCLHGAAAVTSLTFSGPVVLTCTARQREEAASTVDGPKPYQAPNMCHNSHGLVLVIFLL